MRLCQTVARRALTVLGDLADLRLSRRTAGRSTARSGMGNCSNRPATFRCHRQLVTGGQIYFDSQRGQPLIQYFPAYQR